MCVVFVAIRFCGVDPLARVFYKVCRLVYLCVGRVGVLLSFILDLYFGGVIQERDSTN